MSRADRLVTRQACGLRAPTGRTVFLPEFGATVHYSEVPAAADHRSCASQVRAIQAYHMDDRDWDDIAYNDLACQHGVLYEGRGPLVRSAANGTDEGNDAAHAVCALLAAGQPVTAALLDAIVDSLVFYNQQAGAGDGVNGHRDWKPTGCPGDPLYGHLPSIRSRVTAALNPTAPTNPEDDDMLTGYDKNTNDVARATVRELCDTHWGYGKMTVDDQNWLVGEWAKNGRERMMTLLLDHAKAKRD